LSARCLHTGTLIFFFLLALPLLAQTTPPSSDANRVAGVVLNSQTNHPVPGARVTLANAANPQQAMSMVTSDDGRFEFTGVPAGKYPLQGAAKGFITATYDQHQQFSTAIVTGVSGVDTEHLALRLTPAALISGRVLDEAGEPVRNASITLYREDHDSGVGRITHFRGVQTDDQGSYEITSLNPGTYFISVSAAPWYAVHPTTLALNPASNASGLNRSLDVAYPITYYADATNYEEATPIPIRGGDHPEIDFHLNPEPALHMLFRVPNGGREGFQMPSLMKRSFDGVDTAQTMSWQQVSEGVFEMTGVPAGSYILRIPGSAGPGMLSNELDLNKDGQELNAAGGEPLSSVKFTLQFPANAGKGAPASEPGRPRFFVALLDSRGRIVHGQPVNENGEASFDDLSPGKYEIEVGSEQGRFSVTRSSSTNAQISGHTLTVPPGAALTVSISLTGATAKIEGFAKRSGQPAPGAMIVLVPKNPEDNRDLFRRDQSDLDGSFSLQGVIPGDYTVIAIENGWDLDWSQQAVITRYARKGQPLTVPADKQGPIHLSDPIEVQPR
jgi:protocatechuate 3,4-dioxygenase beta subunit